MGRKHLCLTDPDARMMGEGRTKAIRECHNFEVGVDGGLLVVAQSTQEGQDNARLETLVQAAAEHEPAGIVAVDADSGYFAGAAVARLIESGLDVCVPDSNTACDLRRGQAVDTTRHKSQGSVPFTYDALTDAYHCPEGNRLPFSQQRHEQGQGIRIYRSARACTGCPLASACLSQPHARHRTLRIGEHADLLEAHRQRFTEAAHVARYHRRADAVETVFGFVRTTLGFARWSLRGSEPVACEARLLKTAYQIRKIHARQQSLRRAQALQRAQAVARAA